MKNINESKTYNQIKEERKDMPPLQKTLVHKAGILGNDEEAKRVKRALVLKTEHGRERPMKYFAQLLPNLSPLPRQ